MPKIGIYEVPVYTLSECAQIVKTIYDNRIDTLSGLASKLEHKSAKSGTFLRKIADLNRFDLIIQNGNNLRLTELGIKIGHPKSPDEKNMAMRQLTKKIPLFQAIKRKLGDKQPTSDFWKDLDDILQGDRFTAQKEANSVRKLYIDALQYMKTEGEIPSITEGDVMQPGFPTTLTTQQGFMEIKTENSFIRIKRDLEEIERLKAYIDIEEKILKKPKKE